MSRESLNSLASSLGMLSEHERWMEWQSPLDHSWHVGVEFTNRDRSKLWGGAFVDIEEEDLANDAVMAAFGVELERKVREFRPRHQELLNQEAVELKLPLAT